MRERRAAFVISFILLVCAGIGLFYGGKENPSLKIQCLSAKKQEKLVRALETSTEELLPELYFEGESLPKDTESRTFYLPVDMDDPKWEEGVFSAEEGTEVYLLDNPLLDEKAESVRNGKRYRLLAVRGKECREYGVIFTGLPILSLTTDEEIRYDEVYGRMRFFEAGTKKDWVTESLMSGHIRGGSSRLNPKKSYKMTLYQQDKKGGGELRRNKLSLLGMRKDDEWILYAMYSEDSKLRDKLSQDIWNDSGAQRKASRGFFGYHMKYIEVFQNNAYYGIYGLMEPVDYKQLGLTKEGRAHQEEFLYKQKDPEVFELKGNHEITDDEEHTKALEAYLACLSAEDETFREEMPKLIDVDSALEVWIYLQAVIGMDNIERNIFYPARYEGGAYRMYFLPWDMDYTWGNVHDFDAGHRTRFSEEILTMRIAWKLGDRLVRLDVDGAQEKVKNRWRELRESVYSETYLTEHIDAYAHQVLDSGALWRDEALWVDGAHSEDYESLKKLTCGRIAFLDSWLLERPGEYLDLEEYVE